jgi:probable HAF family extracellular repeat protein
LSSRARNVTADGNVVVGQSSNTAFRWTSATGLVSLGNPSGGSNSDAFDVSDDGAVIAGRFNSASGQEAFRWTSSGGYVPLGDLPDGTFGSQATGCTADGSVLVGSGESASGHEAFRWTAGGGMVGLGDLAGGAFFSEANAVSDDGNIVVGVGSTATAGLDAFYWTSAGGMQRLWDVLVANGVDPAADGWTDLGTANDVSADGTHVAGQGNRNGHLEAYLAIVPEPASLSLLALAAPAMLTRRRRSRLGA